MNKDLQNKLYEDFPDLYRGRLLSPQQNLMCYGFSVADGWEPLIRKLSEQLTFLAKVENTPVIAMQVKEKFGTLSFYANDATDIMRACISYVEHFSSQTCEVCGKYGDLRNRGSSGWMKTLCAEHAYESGYWLDDYEAKQMGVTDHIRNPKGSKDGE